MQEISKAMAAGILESISEEEKRAAAKDAERASAVMEQGGRLREIQENHGRNARQVEKYKPNRKQKRAQQASKRRQAKVKT